METSKRKRGRKPKNKPHAETLNLQHPSTTDPTPPPPSTTPPPHPAAAAAAPTSFPATSSTPPTTSPPPPSKRHSLTHPVVSSAAANGADPSAAADDRPKWEQAAKAVPSMDAVVKVFCVHTEPNFSLPWQRKRQYSSSSSGFVIGGRMVLTNAHSVEHHTQVKLKRRGSDTKYLVTMLAIGTECDIGVGPSASAFVSGNCGKDYEYDVPVKLLEKHLHSVAQSPDEQLVAVSQIVVLETKTAKAATPDILTTHCIPSAASGDLKT